MSVTILSGGSKGFDEFVRHCCRQHPNIRHLICIPPCDPQAKTLVPLSKAQLNVALPEVQRTSQALGRIISKATTWPYLQRNAHLVSHATQVLVFGHFDDLRKHVMGVPGWTVQMAKQQGKLLFVFDMEFDEWWWWDSTNRTFRQCQGMSEDWIALPTLAGMTAMAGPVDCPPSLLPHLQCLFTKPQEPVNVLFAR